MGEPKVLKKNETNSPELYILTALFGISGVPGKKKRAMKPIDFLRSPPEVEKCWLKPLMERLKPVFVEK